MMLKSRLTRISLGLSAVVVTLLWGGVSNISVYAEEVEEAESTIEITVASEATVDILPNSANGTFSSTSLVIRVGTNNPTGYYLDMTSASSVLTSSTTAVDASGVTYTPTIATLGTGESYTETDFKSSALTMNKWAFNLDGTNYVPVTTTPVRLKSSSEAVEGDETTVLFGAKVDSTQPAGIYGTTITLVAVTNPAELGCAANTICYDANGADGANTVASQAVTSNANATLMPANFVKADYGFAGWNTESDGSGDSYGPTETIAVGDLSTSGLTLYANWIAKSTSYTMQTFDSTVCQAMPQITYNSTTGKFTTPSGSMIALEDTRDGNVYTVAKLMDGNCWMIENLRFSDDSVAFSSSNTDAPASGFSLGTTSSNWCDTTDAACIFQSAINTTNTTSSVASVTAGNANILSYGVYYNWYTSTAGNATASDTTKNESISGSICPNGWKLPRGGSYPNTNITTGGVTGTETDDNTISSDFYGLVSGTVGGTPDAVSSSDSTVSYYTTGADKMMSYPNNFILSGSISGSNFSGLGSGAYYWSSTVNSANNTYYFGIDGTAVYPGTKIALQNNGFAVRCLAE